MRTLPILAVMLSVAACSSPTAESVVAAEAPAPGVEDTRAWLREFGAHYQYDVGYMEALLDLSPEAFERFAAGIAMAEPRGHLSTDAHYVGITSALMADDCGQCTQLCLRMAVEAGVDRAILASLLEDPQRLPPDLLLIHDYATHVVQGRNVPPHTVARLRADLGDAAFAELAVNVLGVRNYPALRRAMGAETECPAATLDF